MLSKLALRDFKELLLKTKHPVLHTFTVGLSHIFKTYECLGWINLIPCLTLTLRSNFPFIFGWDLILSGFCWLQRYNTLRDYVPCTLWILGIFIQIVIVSLYLIYGFLRFRWEFNTILELCLKLLDHRNYFLKDSDRSIWQSLRWVPSF